MLTSEECVGSLQPLLPHVIYVIGFASFAGATMPISMFSDLLSLFTVHIYCFYTASARIFHWQLTIIMSLFHLFRGKKHNVLRNRIDSCDYDLDQLLLGTILFTLLFFLLPTVVVFYLTFTSARMAIISLKAALDTSLAFLNHFPLFALMLRLKDPRRLPGKFHEIRKNDAADECQGGISFELGDSTSASLPAQAATDAPPTSYIMLQVSVVTYHVAVNPKFCHSPSRSHCGRCLSNTSSLDTVFASIIFHRELFYAWLLGSSFHQSIGKACIVCNTACCPLSAQVY